MSGLLTQTGRAALALAGARGLSDKDLALLLDMDPATLSRKKSGRQPWNDADRWAVLQALGADIESLVTDLQSLRATREYQAAAPAGGNTESHFS